MSNQIRHIRLATFGRLNDRFLTVQFQKNPNAAEAGQLYFVVEIKNPWFSASQIGQSIINVFSREYFKGDDTSDFLNFENAIKKVNETLAQVTQSGETDWIGNLNAAIALINNQELNLTATGDVHILLWRGEKLSEVRATEKGGEVHPLKTFGDIVAGTLEKNDRLLVANSELLNYFNLEKIKQSLRDLPLQESGEQLAHELKRQKIKNINALILELKDEEGLTQIPLTEETEVIYLDQARGLPSTKIMIKFSREKIIPVLVLIGLKSWFYLKKFAVFNRDKVYPQVKKVSVHSYQKSQPVFKALAGKIGASSQKLVEKSPALKRMLNKKTVIVEGMEDGMDKIGLNVHHYALQPNRRGARWLNNLKNYLLSFWAGLRNAVRFLFRRENRALLYIILAVILITVIVLTGVVRRRKGNEEENVASAEQMLAKASEENESAKSAQKSNDLERAKKMWHEAIVDALVAQKTAAWREEANKILNEAESNLDQLTGTKRLKENDAVISFPNNVNLMIETNGMVYGVDKKTGQISEASLILRQPQKIAKLSSADGEFESAVLLPESKAILLTGASAAEELDLASKKLASPKLVSGASFEDNVAINLYANTLYLLDPNQNQIWKHIKTNDSWDKGAAYNTRRIDLKKGISMAIDGFVWVLKDNGEITKISKSERQDFKLNGLPLPMDKITKPIKLITDADTNLAWILDSGENRIIEFDKNNGNFTRQFGLPHNVIEPTDFLVNPKSQQILILADNKVFEFSMI